MSVLLFFTLKIVAKNHKKCTITICSWTRHFRAAMITYDHIWVAWNIGIHSTTFLEIRNKESGFWNCYLLSEDSKSWSFLISAWTQVVIIILWLSWLIIVLLISTFLVSWLSLLWAFVSLLLRILVIRFKNNHKLLRH